jgi:hypothetical protein
VAERKLGHDIVPALANGWNRIGNRSPLKIMSGRFGVGRAIGITHAGVRMYNKPYFCVLNAIYLTYRILKGGDDIEGQLRDRTGATNGSFLHSSTRWTPLIFRKETFYVRKI